MSPVDPPESGQHEPADDAHRPFREMLGAYLLGHLTDEERVAVEARLDGSPSLRAELAELRPVVALLPHVRGEDLGTRPAPPADLGDRIMQRIGRERAATRLGVRRQLWRSTTIGGAVLAAAAVIALAFAIRSDGDTPGPQRPTREIELASSVEGQTARATLTGFGWGTRIEIAAQGLVDPGTVYTVYLEDAAGNRIAAGTFRGLADQPIECVMSSALQLGEASDLTIEIETPDGEPGGNDGGSAVFTGAL